jgi:hypothetical protein
MVAVDHGQTVGIESTLPKSMSIFRWRFSLHSQNPPWVDLSVRSVNDTQLPPVRRSRPITEQSRQTQPNSSLSES